MERRGKLGETIVQMDTAPYFDGLLYGVRRLQRVMSGVEGVFDDELWWEVKEDAVWLELRLSKNKTNIDLVVAVVVVLYVQP